MQALDRGEGVPSAGGLSLVGAVATFLAMWGGLTLLLTDPQGPCLPPLTSTPRGMLVSLLLFWVPLATGGLACLSGDHDSSLPLGNRPSECTVMLERMMHDSTPLCNIHHAGMEAEQPPCGYQEFKVHLVTVLTHRNHIH